MGSHLRALEDVEANTVRLKDMAGDDILVLERIEKTMSLHAFSYEPSYWQVLILRRDTPRLSSHFQLYCDGWAAGENFGISTRDESG